MTGSATNDSSSDCTSSGLAACLRVDPVEQPLGTSTHYHGVSAAIHCAYCTLGHSRVMTSVPSARSMRRPNTQRASTAAGSAGDVRRRGTVIL